jgi:hypothetical protein
MACLFLVLGSVLWTRADTMTLSNGEVVKGRFIGFSERKFAFKSEAGVMVSEYPVNVKSILPAAPLKVSLELARSKYDDVEFRAFDEFTLHLIKDGEPLDERVIMLKSLTVNRPPEPVKPPPPAPEEPAAVAKSGRGDPKSPAEAREWQRSGKWREMDPKNTLTISKGEEVDIEEHLKKGFINIVHFHNPKLLPSIREGNYVEALAAKPMNRIVILRIVTPGFEAPVCEALGIKSLPQFWFYDPRGRLAKKLTDRFTEGDIDEALKLARHGVE